MFPITPVFNSSLQYSHNQSISLISKPQDQGTIILSLPQHLKLPYTIVQPIPHINTPSKHLNYNEIQQTSSTIYNPPIFPINHRSTPCLVTGLHITQIIDLGLDSLVDISCMQGYTSRQHHARVSEDLLIENEPRKSSNLFHKNKQIDRVRGRV